MLTFPADFMVSHFLKGVEMGIIKPPKEVTPRVRFDVALTPEQIETLNINIYSFMRPDREPTIEEVRENCKRCGLPEPVSFYLPIRPEKYSENPKPKAG